jgi:hypothetical protein
MVIAGMSGWTEMAIVDARVEGVGHHHGDDRLLDGSL